MTNLELQGLLLVSELELHVKAGNTLPVDIVIAIDNFRKMEVLTYGQANFQVAKMLEELRKQVGHLNNN